MKCDHMGDPAIRSHQFASVRNDPSPRQKRDRLSHQLVQTKKAAYPRKGLAAFWCVGTPGQRFAQCSMMRRSIKALRLMQSCAAASSNMVRVSGESVIPMAWRFRLSFGVENHLEPLGLPLKALAPR